MRRGQNTELRIIQGVQERSLKGEGMGDVNLVLVCWLNYCFDRT